MKLLLDTCALLWLVLDPDRLSRNARAALVTANGGLHVSAFSALEIAIKHAKGKLRLPMSPAAWYARALDAYDIRDVPVTSDIALRAPLVDMAHGDPADRVIVATAIVEHMDIVTGDERIAACGTVRVIR